MKHTVSALVENHPGVLYRVAGLIARRGYNIASLAASATEEEGLTRISIVVDVNDERELEQIQDQLSKLVEVIHVVNMTQIDHVSREMALVKVNASEEHRADITNLVAIFRAKIIDVHPDSLVLEVTGDVGKVDAFCEMMRKYGIIEIIRTGEIFISRSTKRLIDN